MSHRDVFVASCARTAIGTFGGSLKDVPNSQLATIAVKAAIERAGIAADAVGHVVMGNVIPTDTKDAYLARVAAIDAGCPIETPAMNVNRLCGSGLQAIRRRILARDYGMCQCPTCKRLARVRPAHIVDHIKPIKEGGEPLALDNLQALCWSCHSTKSLNDRHRRGRGESKVQREPLRQRTSGYARVPAK